MTVPTPPRSLRLLLAHAIDYAGLFPPAGLAMEGAAANYDVYRASDDAWALGRFICPASRLPQLAAALDAADGPASADPWRVAATLGEDWPADRARIRRFNERSDARVDAVEGRTADPAAVRRLASFAEDGFVTYGELPLASDTDDLIESLRGAALAAKIRMGGVTPERFPGPERVARFLMAASRVALPFKATAGLHHAIRGEYPLSYEPDSACGTMFGYLNLLLAALVASAGAERAEVIAVLEERSTGAFALDDGGAAWQGYHVDLAAIERFRLAFHGFGSCSFREPIEALSQTSSR